MHYAGTFSHRPGPKIVSALTPPIKDANKLSIDDYRGSAIDGVAFYWYWRKLLRAKTISAPLAK